MTRSGRHAWAVVLMLLLMVLLTACDRAEAASDADAKPVAFLRSVADDDHPALIDELRQHGFHPTRELRVLPPNPSQVFDDVEEARRALLAWHEASPLALVVAFSTPYAQLAMDELPDVPTIFVVNDPVAGGLVSDPDQPDRGATGVSFWTPADRTLELTSRIVNGLERLGYLAPDGDPAVPGHRDGALEAAAAMGIEVTQAVFEPDAESIEEAVRQLEEAEVDAVLLASSNTTLQMLPELERSLDRHALPAVSNTDHATFAVLVVTPDGEELRRQVARLAARVLGGAPVRHVPVEAPRRFTVEISRTKAQELGLPELDEMLLRQADMVR